MAAHIPSISNEPKERNRQLLEIMAKKLSKMSSFEQYANRLANWASDPRAYYDDVKETVCVAFVSLKYLLTGKVR